MEDGGPNPTEETGLTGKPQSSVCWALWTQEAVAMSQPAVSCHWPGMKGDAYQVCKSRVTCLSTQGHKRRAKPPLKCIEVGEPFECIGMDIKEFDMSSKGNRYALVFQDYLTKWPEIYPLPDHKAPTVAGCLVDLIWRHAVPSRINHDRAPEFLSDVFQNTAAVFGVKHAVAHIRGPSSNRWSH